MPTAWFLMPYKQTAYLPNPERQCEVEEHLDVIAAGGGTYQYVEVLGNYAVGKILALEGTLGVLQALPNWYRFASQRLDDPLSMIDSGQYSAIRAWCERLGYSLSEIDSRLPGYSDWGDLLFREVLNFMATRRMRTVVDWSTGVIALAGETVPCDANFDAIETQVSE